MERWTRRFFQPVHLWEVGHHLFIPHAGKMCEYLLSTTPTLEQSEQEQDAKEQQVLTQWEQWKGKSRDHAETDPDVPDGQGHPVAGPNQHAPPLLANEAQWGDYYQWKASGAMEVDGHNDDDELPALMLVDDDSDVDSVIGGDDGGPHVSVSRDTLL